MAARGFQGTCSSFATFQPLTAGLSDTSLKIGVYTRSLGVRFACLGKIKNNITNNISEGKGHDCFARMLQTLRHLLKNVHYLRICLDDFATKSEVLGFLSLGKWHNLVPDYVDEVETEKTRQLELSVRKTDKPHIYAALAYTRFLRDNPYLVKNVLHLVFTKGVSFWPALFYCMCFNVTRAEHSFVPVQRALYPAEKHPGGFRGLETLFVDSPGYLYKAHSFFSKPGVDVDLKTWEVAWAANSEWRACRDILGGETEYNTIHSYPKQLERIEYVQDHPCTRMPVRLLLTKWFEKALEKKSLEEFLLVMKECKTEGPLPKEEQEMRAHV